MIDNTVRTQVELAATQRILSHLLGRVAKQNGRNASQSKEWVEELMKEILAGMDTTTINVTGSGTNPEEARQLMKDYIAQQLGSISFTERQDDR